MADLKKGDRVRVSLAGFRSYAYGSNYRDRLGTVLAEPSCSRSGCLVTRVLWDGRRSVDRLCVEFLEAAPAVDKKEVIK